MEFYRNVKVDRDTTLDQQREEAPPVMDSLSDILSGVDVPPMARVAAAADGDAEEAEAAAPGDEE
jgi:hypothetical protein